MATPTHPNQFAIGQSVLFRQADLWRPGMIVAVTHIKAQAALTHSDDDWEPDTRRSHNDECDGVFYNIKPGDVDDIDSSFVRPVKMLCTCTTGIVDADATGRWHGQRVTSPDQLELLMRDAVSLDCRLEPVWVETPGSDLIMFALDTPPGRERVYWAEVAIDDLITWHAGIMPAEWKKEAA